MSSQGTASHAAAGTASARPPEHRAAGAPAALLSVAAVVLLAVNLRLVFASVSPLLHGITAANGLDSTTAGLLTTAPVLCLGLGAPLAGPLARRTGTSRALLGCLAAVAAGAVLRALPGTPLLFAGTVLAGAAIAIANVLVPAVIRQHFPDRVGPMTGVATMLISGGSALAAGLSAPAQQLFGDSWRLALAVWALPALLAATCWIPLARRDAPAPAGPATRAAGTGAGRNLLPRGTKAWQVTCFMGAQSLLAYALMAWLPQLLRDHGLSAGAAGGCLAALSLASVPSALLVPALAARRRSQRVLAVAVVLPSALGILGLLLAPTALALPCSLLLGLGQGGELGLSLTLINLRSATPEETAALSGSVQTVGYLLAALGPVSVGALRSLAGGWSLPLLSLLALTLPMALVGAAAGTPGLIRRSSP